eukprot:4253594-Prymnesium_polylepis.1
MARGRVVSLQSGRKFSAAMSTAVSSMSISLSLVEVCPRATTRRRRSISTTTTTMRLWKPPFTASMQSRSTT